MNIQQYRITATDGRKTIESVVIGNDKQTRLKRVCRNNKIPKTQWESFNILTEEKQ